MAIAAPNSALGQAENYEAIRVDAGLVGAYAKGVSAGGFGGTVEPKFLLTDHIGVGLRLEGHFFFGTSVSSGDEDISYSSGTIGAILAKAEYLLGDFFARPVAGVAIGSYSIGGDSVRTSEAGAELSRRRGRFLGVGPQLALEFGRLRLATSYNIMLGADIEVQQRVGEPDSVRGFSQNFWTFEVSVHFGGTRLQKKADRDGPAGP